jgi:hypothetical protein
MIQERAAAIFAGLTFRLILIGIIAVMFVDSYVSVRIPLPLLSDIVWTGWKPLAIERGETIKGFVKAQEQAGKAQQAVNDTEQNRLDTITEGSENAKALTDTAVRAAVADYARTHRVPEGASCPSSSAVAAAPGESAGVDQGVPADSQLLVSEPDLHALSEATGYAVRCRALVLDIEGQSGRP